MTTTSNTFSWETDSSLSRDYNWDSSIAETCIIAVPNNPHSERSGADALDSCHRVGQVNPRIFHGYDGTDLKTIKTPAHLVGNSVMSMIKVVDCSLSITEVACALSHIAAWVHCINFNKPIVVLEHDALMLRPFRAMTYTNSLEYLGHASELENLYAASGVWDYDELVEHYREIGEYPEATLRLPVTMVINYNYLFCHGLHAYAIDPFMARRLLVRVLEEGLSNAIDVVVEVTDFTVVQTGIYAAQGPAAKTSTIDSNSLEASAKHVPGQGRKHLYSIPGVSQ